MIKMSQKEINIKDLYKVVNIVASAKLNIGEKREDRIDLSLIAIRYKDSEYNPSVFPGLIFKIKEPKSTVLIFSTGKFVITGIRKIEDIDKVVSQIIKIIKKNYNKPINGVHTNLQNMVANGDLHTPVNLTLMGSTLTQAIYEPEVFPGLIYRMENPKVVFLIFSSGKIVCVGAKSEIDISNAINKLLKQIQELGFEM